MDVFSKNKRSEIMSKIRSKNTKAELIVFHELRKRKIYFQKHYKKAIGSPDIAFPRKKIAIFIDGDFWHGRNFSKNKKKLPKKYWREKISSNILRDIRNKIKLKKQGWRVLRIWERELLKNKEKTIEKIVNFLNSFKLVKKTKK